MNGTGPSVPGHLYAAVETLWNYHRIDDDPRPADVGIGLGSHDLGVATHIADLHHRGFFALIVFTGATSPTTVGRFPRGEAVHYREHALELGVPENAILVEPGATNTGENLTRTRELLARHGVTPSSAIIASRPYQQRRVLATAGRIWPELDVVCTALSQTLDEHLDSVGDADAVIDMLVGDTQRVIDYPDRGFAVPQDVPEHVVRAFSMLVEHGYTSRLLP